MRRKKNAMADRWKQWELELLFRRANEGAEAVAEATGRTVRSVQHMASRMAVSLRRTYYCPNCGQETYSPLSPRTGWCRACSIAQSRDSAAVKNREVAMKLKAEERRVNAIKQERGKLYVDTCRKKRRLREVGEVDGNSQIRKEK